MLFSGQSALGPLITNSASYTVGALLLLIACKGLACGVSLSSFRGGPTFPALFIGAAGGIALSHLPGLPQWPRYFAARLLIGVRSEGRCSNGRFARLAPAARRKRRRADACLDRGEFGPQLAASPGRTPKMSRTAPGTPATASSSS